VLGSISARGVLVWSALAAVGLQVARLLRVPAAGMVLRVMMRLVMLLVGLGLGLRRVPTVYLRRRRRGLRGTREERGYGDRQHRYKTARMADRLHGPPFMAGSAAVRESIPPEAWGESPGRTRGS
jgi:hypothetical protein